MNDTIAVNGRFLTQRVSGVQRFATELLRALGAEAPGRLSVYTPASVGQVSIPGIEHLRVGRLAGHAWEQFELPAALQKVGTPPLLSLCNTGPLTYRNHYFTLHDITFIRYPGGFSWKFRTAYRIAVPRLLESSRVIFTVSQFSATEICSAYPVERSRIRVIYNAASTLGQSPYPQLPTAVTTPYFLTVGHLGSNKNIDTLVKGYALYRRRRGRASLVIVGSYRGKAPVTGDGIVCVGGINDDELSALYSSAVAYVTTSLYEGFSLPLIEAQSHGCPVIASDTPIHREVLGATAAALFPPMSPMALAEALAEVPTMTRADIAARGTANAARFSWRDSAKEALATILDSQPR